MSGLAGLSPEYINFITGNLPIADATRAELRNFLRGRITTASDIGEFSNALKGITQDIEAVGGLPPGQATGEIIGALEGGAVLEVGAFGAIAYRADQIFTDIMELATHNANEEKARNELRDQIQRERSRGIVHGAQGTPTNIEDIAELLRQQERQREIQRGKQGGFDEDVKINIRDPVRQRPQVSEDIFEDVDIEEKTPIFPKENIFNQPTTEGKTAAGLAGAAAGAIVGATGAIIKGAAGGTAVPPNITLKPAYVPKKGEDRKQVETGERESEQNPGVRQGQGTTPASRPISNDPANIDKPSGEPLLRPYFKEVGTDFFDKMYDTPLRVQNSEWAEYDFVDIIDRQNNIEVDNVLGERIRFQSPLYYPKYQAPLAPPTKQSIILKQIPMKREIQLSQPFMPKFDKADMGEPVVMTLTYNHSVFDYNFKNLKIYNPV